MTFKGFLKLTFYLIIVIAALVAFVLIWDDFQSLTRMFSVRPSPLTLVSYLLYLAASLLLMHLVAALIGIFFRQISTPIIRRLTKFQMNDFKTLLKFFLKYSIGGAIGLTLCLILSSNASIPIFKLRSGFNALEFFLAWLIGGFVGLLLFSPFHKVLLAKDKSDDEEPKVQ